MQTLNQDIKDRSFKSAYLLFGDEAFLKKSYKNRLKEAVTGGDTMNYNYYEGKGINVPEILGMADTMPFFAEKRLILVEDSGFFKGGGEAESLAEYLPNVPDTTCLLFVETEVDKRSKLYKAVKKYGYAAEMVRQEPAQLARSLSGRDNGIVIGNSLVIDIPALRKILITSFLEDFFCKAAHL